MHLTPALPLMSTDQSVHSGSSGSVPLHVTFSTTMGAVAFRVRVQCYQKQGRLLQCKSLGFDMNVLFSKLVITLLLCSDVMSLCRNVKDRLATITSQSIVRIIDITVSCAHVHTGTIYYPATILYRTSSMLFITS